MTRTLVAGAAMLMLASGCGASDTDAGLRSSGSTPAAPQGEECSPWLEECPEADWVQRVLDRAGYRIVGDTGAVFIVASRDGGEFFFWAMDPSTHSQVQPLKDFIGPKGYRLYDEMAGAAVYTDGVRWVWEAQGLNVWAETEARPSPSKDELEDLIHATKATLYHG